MSLVRLCGLTCSLREAYVAILCSSLQLMVSILFVRVRKTDQDAVFYGNILKACKKNKNYSVAYYGIYPCCQ